MASDTPAGQPATLPAAAVQAAIEAVMGRRNLVSDESRKWARPIVVDALEAAAPHLAAAERERLAAWLEGPEARAVTAAAIKADVEQQITEGVAAAQARVAELEALVADMLGDKAVWAAVMAGPKLGEDADDPRVVRRMLEAARKAVLDGGSGE